MALEYNRRCELEAIERLQAENENLKAKLENRDLNIRHLTKLLKLAGTVRFNIEKTIVQSEYDLENMAYLRDNFIDDRMDFYTDFGLCEEEARESAEEDALEHFPAPKVTQ